MHIKKTRQDFNYNAFFNLTTLELTTHSTTQKIRTLPSPPVPVRPVEGYS